MTLSKKEITQLVKEMKENKIVVVRTNTPKIIVDLVISSERTPSEVPLKRKRIEGKRCVISLLDRVPKEPTTEHSKSDGHALNVVMRANPIVKGCLSKTQFFHTQPTNF